MLTAAPARVTQPPRLMLAEVRKMTTTHLWWILGLCALAALALALVVNGFLGHYELQVADSPPEPGAEPGSEDPVFDDMYNKPAVLARTAANIFTSGQYFGLLIVMLLGIILVTNEFAHQTATSTFLATPRRERIVVAKLVTVLGAAAGLWFVMTAISLVAGLTFFTAEGEPNSFDQWSVQRSIAMNLLAYALWAVVGVGVGALIRSQLAATITGAAAYMVGGQLVTAAFFILYLWLEQSWIIELMVLAPSVASQVMVSPERMVLGGTEDGPIYGPQWWVGALVLIGYGVISGVVGSLLLRRRDIS